MHFTDDAKLLISIFALVISIISILITVLDFKTKFYASSKKKYLDRLFVRYIDKIITVCYINIHDKNNEFRMKYDFLDLKEINFVDKITNLIEQYISIQTDGFYISSNIQDRIDKLERINSLLHAYLHLECLGDIIDKDEFASGCTNALEALYDIVKEIRGITDNSASRKIAIQTLKGHEHKWKSDY
jgi:hypothetical protein